MTTLHHAPAHLTQLMAAHFGHDTLILGIVATAGFAIGAAAGVVLSLVRHPKPLASNHPHPLTPQPTPMPSQSEAALAQRAALITGMLTVRGLIDDPQVADVVDDSMRAAGITVLDPTGHRKDPRYHRVRHTEPATQPSQAGTVARTLAPGYIDSGRVLQPADVVVYL